jgi:hypothetical protein
MATEPETSIVQDPVVARIRAENLARQGLTEEDVQERPEVTFRFDPPPYEPPDEPC